MAENLEHSKVDRAPVGWGFWLLWVLATTVGWAAGVLIMVFVGIIVRWATSSDYADSSTGMVVGVILLFLGLSTAGAVSGALQRLVLRRRLPLVRGWVLVSAVGWPVSWLGGGPVGGVLLGALQWLVLRKGVARAGWWVLASFVGMAVGFVVAGAVGGALVPILEGGGAWAVVGSWAAGWRAVGPWAVAGSVVAPLYGALTGAALVWLLRQPLPPEGEAAEE